MYPKLLEVDKMLQDDFLATTLVDCSVINCILELLKANEHFMLISVSLRRGFDFKQASYAY
jgi:hypothetical protein